MNGSPIGEEVMAPEASRKHAAANSESFRSRGESPLKLGINGFGRIGRLAFRAALEAGIPVAAVNSTAGSGTLTHLLKHDSSYGTLKAAVRAGEQSFSVDGKETMIFSEQEPGKVPWFRAGVGVVLECTGKFRDRASAGQHLQGGAKKVIIAAPGNGEDATLVMGVNEQEYDREKHHVISNASCTTNCLAPVAKVLHEAFGIQRGFMTTVHAYTGDQRLLDGTHKDLRRARSAAESIIPTTTGAAEAVGKVLPALEGRINGFAMRVPTGTVSVVDFTAVLAREAGIEDLNEAFREAAGGELKGILSVCEEPLVSVDFRGNPHSAVVDAQSTMVMGSMAKVLAWYDNEWAYAMRLVELAAHVMKQP